MGNQEIFKQLPDILLPWYRQNKRELPWRGIKDPYRVWVSEIMLQQTRVEAVKGYYARFLKELPDIRALANVDDELLHKLWEGLGYYSRVRNLKKAAQKIVADHNGVFPGEYEAVRALPGIGDYTAGAVCSIAFDQPTPAVDGNVLRVVARLTDDSTPVDLPVYKKQTTASLAEIYPQEAGEFTQALMELGATVCGPNRKPDCGVCPCRNFCLANKRGTAEHLPVRLPKRSRKTEEKTILIFSCDGLFAVEKRPETGLLAGLWQFPELPGRWDTQKLIEKVEELGYKPKELLRTVEKKHIFTHIEWNMQGVYIDVAEMNPAISWFSLEQLQKEIPLPTAFRQFLDAVS